MASQLPPADGRGGSIVPGTSTKIETCLKFLIDLFLLLRIRIKSLNLKKLQRVLHKQFLQNNLFSHRVIKEKALLGEPGFVLIEMNPSLVLQLMVESITNGEFFCIDAL